MSKQFLIVVAAVLLGLVGLYALTNNSEPANSNTQPTNHVRGEGTKKVTLVEYGDFQCPSCGAYYPTLEQVVEAYGDDITFQFRHFPLTNIHPNAFAASRAAEAAGKQGKFFEMYGMLYQNQTLWSDTASAKTTFQTYAKRMNLDMAQYNSDFASAAVNAAINADMAEGTKLGVQGTPSFFLNGKPVEIRNTLADFKKLIDNEITKKNPVDNSTSSQESQLPADNSAPTPSPAEVPAEPSPSADAAN